MDYKCLNRSVFKTENYKIVAIRLEDRFDIMKWRNDQMHHLRQNEKLSIEEQDKYFSETISALFNEAEPRQILFSFLLNDKCIGYGGLVHINWIDKNAEISFLIDTQLEKNYFEVYWEKFLSLIESVAFSELKFNKIFAFSYNLRPLLYKVLAKCSYLEEGRLKEHYKINNIYVDALYHSKFNNHLFLRNATLNDMLLYYQWANDNTVRQNSFNSNFINFKEHQKWFVENLNSVNTTFYIFENHLNISVGQVRLIKTDDYNATIGISVDERYRGKGYALIMIKQASNLYLKTFEKIKINAYIKDSNIISSINFQKAGYKFVGKETLNQEIRLHYYYENF
jgi:RimJ/RimL family protein N-acetyltransferase